MVDGDIALILPGLSTIYPAVETIEVHRSCESIPNTFTITCTESTGALAAIPEGSRCEIRFGDDPVLTGFVDTVAVDRGPRSRQVIISGRGKTSDLVDCTCMPQVKKGVENLSFAGLDLEAIAGELCAPYGVDYSVRSALTPLLPQTSGSASPPPFTAQFVDTPAAVMTELARFYGLMLYEDVDGSLVFERAGTTPAASGFVYGQNIEHYRFSRSMADRFSEIRVYTTATAESLNAEFDNVTLVATKTDPNVTRFRRHAQVCASPVLGYGEREAAWEVSRRLGRSRTFSSTVTGWRDAAGALWAPNTRAPVQIPELAEQGEAGWIISDVTFRRDGEAGTTTEVSLMPAAAFDVEPIVLTTEGADVRAELARQNAGS